MIRVVVVVRVHRFRAWEVVAVCPLVFLVAPSLAQEAPLGHPLLVDLQRRCL